MASKKNEPSALVVTNALLPVKSFTYVCSNCGDDVTLKKNDPIQCKSCGYRILHKRRKITCSYYAV
jgi:DNA-directed RNA polymerase I, II, and III subunit RPABC4